MKATLNVFISLTGPCIWRVTHLAIVSSATRSNRSSDLFFVYPHSYYTVRVHAVRSRISGIG